MWVSLAFCTSEAPNQTYASNDAQWQQTECMSGTNNAMHPHSRRIDCNSCKPFPVPVSSTHTHLPRSATPIRKHSGHSSDLNASVYVRVFAYPLHHASQASHKNLTQRSRMHTHTRWKSNFARNKLDACKIRRALLSDGRMQWITMCVVGTCSGRIRKVKHPWHRYWCWPVKMNCSPKHWRHFVSA